MTNKKIDIGIIVAVAAEAGILCRKLKVVPGTEGRYYQGILAGKHIVLGLAGIGKVNASYTCTQLIRDFSPALIMNIGIGGAYPSSGLKIGDVAIAEKEIYGDEGLLLKDGFHGLDHIGIPSLNKGRKKYFNEFPLDRHLVDKTVSVVSRLTLHASRKGPFLTLSTCTGTTARASELERRFGAVCENMEGAAIAHVCMLSGIQLMEMRGISNIVENRDLSKWDIALAAENCQRAALEYIRTI